MPYRFNPFTGNLDFFEKSNGNGFLKSELVAVTVSNINTWVLVPLTILSSVFEIEIYDETNTEKVIIDARINVDGSAEIRSNRIKTFTVRLMGE